MDRYDPSTIEPKWQKVWADEGTWEVSNDPDERRVIPMTFSDLLMREILELEERKTMKVAGLDKKR